MASSSKKEVYGIQIPDQSRGGLANLAFSTWSPPDIQPKTRIIALCGVTDYTEKPSLDFSSSSDNESLKKSFSGKGKKGMERLMSGTKNYFTSSKTSKKITRKNKKKKPLLSGLASPEADGWFLSDFFMFYHLFKGLVFDAADLLQDFLRNFQDECRTAAKLNQPVLLMIFGHGDPITYGVAIGGRGSPINAPRLHVNHIVASLRSLDVALTMLLTSCYSGGWALQPNLNISALTAASAEKPSWSWPASLSGRSHGSVYATAVREALIKMEDEKVTQYHPASSDDIFERPDYSSSYAELARVIHSTLLNDVDRLGSRHGIQFSAKDDVWELERRKRSGIPLAAFQSRWEALPRMPVQSGSSLRRNKAGGVDTDLSVGTITNNIHGLSERFNDNQANSATKDLAYGYLNSFPPPENSAPDKITNLAARSLLKGNCCSYFTLEDLHATLAYRLGLMSLASAYKNPVGLEFCDCENFDYESWQESLLCAIDTSAEARDRWQKFSTYSEMIHQAPVFDPPTARQGWHYNKPNDYLAASFAESNLTIDQVKEAMKIIISDKHAHVEALTERVRINQSVRIVASKFFNTFGKQMRSVSLQQRGKIPNFTEVMAS